MTDRPIPDETMRAAKAARENLCLDYQCTFDRGCGRLDGITRALLEAENRGMRRGAEWRPLDTAPHDGTTILLFSPDAADPQVMIGFWTDWEDDAEPGNWTDAWTMQEIDAWPTHWMPLPAAPAILAEIGEGA